MRVQIAACVLSAALVACSDEDQTSPAQAPGQTAEVAVVYEAGPHVAQCAAPAVSLAQSTAKLTQAGIQALRSSCGGIAGVAYPAVCGAPTGEILVHNIPTASLAAAKAAGFESAETLVNTQRGTGWRRFRCEGYQPFKDIAAQGSMCAGTRNRLLSIDHPTQGSMDLILLDQAGNCADAAYRQVLYGASASEILCSNAQTIAGPRKSCPVAEYAAMFDTIITNLDKVDLGLGAPYAVVEIAQ